MLMPLIIWIIIENINGKKMTYRTRCPSHPGRILKNLYLKPMGLSTTKLAEVLGVSRKAISAIINERKIVTPDMALRLSRAFPNSTAESWLNLQKNYDLWQAANKSDKWQAVQPVPMAVGEDGEEYSVKE